MYENVFLCGFRKHFKTLKKSMQIMPEGCITSKLIVKFFFLFFQLLGNDPKIGVRLRPVPGTRTEA